MARAIREKIITAAGQYTTRLWVPRGQFQVTIDGITTWATGVQVERSTDHGASWRLVEAHTVSIVRVGQEAVGAWYRVGVPAGATGAGPATVRVGY